ncbi:MAG: amidohydrolase family protein [Sphingopyxis sp.]|nr:amidohydrolase family protein [Sphingopyxis sp.]
MNAPATLTRSGLEGTLLDCDAHLYMEPNVMEDIVRDVGAGFVMDFLKRFSGSPDDVAGRARNRDNVWAVKGISALGATEAGDRLEAMDRTGIAAQLVFPNTALIELRVNSPAAREACRRYNDFAIAWTRQAGGRARVVCQINMGDPEWAIAELARVLKLGAKGVLLPCAAPPGGVSPANEIWDPFWAMLQDANVPALIHIAAGGVVNGGGPDDPMLPPREFAYAKSLRMNFDGRAGGEEAIGPYFVLVAHMAAEVFLLTMVMGGVFDRFPRLALGIIEVGAGWLGPLCERMDQHADLMAKVGITYPLKPSEYVRRNVRVTPMWAENLEAMVQRYGLAETYVFSSDYPHIEGSKDPIGKFRKWTDRLDPAFERAFYVDNAAILFPG